MQHPLLPGCQSTAVHGCLFKTSILKHSEEALTSRHTTTESVPHHASALGAPVASVSNSLRTLEKSAVHTISRPS